MGSGRRRRAPAPQGVPVIGIANNPDTPLLQAATVAICLPTPPEVLAGSTRMGAGTAQKAALNLISTLAGVRLGHVHDGPSWSICAPTMPSCATARPGSSPMSHDVSEAVAAQALNAARHDTKTACLIAAGAMPAAGRGRF